MSSDRTPQESIGERLRRLRQERGLSQRELSSPGVSYAYISRIEAGARRPSVKALRMLARKLGVSADYLETGSDIRDVDERELQLADVELELRLTEDPVAAEEKLGSLLEDAVMAGDVPAAMRARLALGLAAARAGRNSEAVERLEEATSSALLSPARRPDVFATLGRCYSALGRPQQAVELFESCLSAVTEQVPDDAASHVRFATYLSYALTDVGDLDRAQSVLDDVLPRADEIGDAYTRVRLYWSLARLNNVGGQPAAALDYVRRAIALLEVTDDSLHLARAHLLCGTIMMSQGRLEEAAGQFTSAEQLFGPRPDPLDVGNMRTDQARLEAKRGAADEAVAHAREALDLLSDQYPAEEGSAWWALAEALALKEDVDGANDAFQRAAALLGEHGPETDFREASRSWARFLRREGRENEALDVLERLTEDSGRVRRTEASEER